jgi:hypothetical protein
MLKYNIFNRLQFKLCIHEYVVHGMYINNYVIKSLLHMLATEKGKNIFCHEFSIYKNINALLYCTDNNKCTHYVKLVSVTKLHYKCTYLYFRFLQYLFLILL